MAKKNIKKLKNRLKGHDYKRLAVLIISIITITLVIINTYPYYKYYYEPGDISKDNIEAPKDIENTYASEQKALLSMEKVENYEYDVKESVSEAFEITNTFFQLIRDLREYYSLESISNPNSTYNLTKQEFLSWIEEKEIMITENQINYLSSETNDEEIERFSYITYDILTSITSEKINRSNLSDYIITAQNTYRQKGLEQEIVAIGQAFVRNVIFENQKVDYFVTNEIKDKEYFETLVNSKVIINKGELIIQKGEVIDEETYQILYDSRLLREKGFLGYASFISIFLLIVSIMFFYSLYIKKYYEKKYKDIKEYIILLVVIVITLILSIVAQAISPYALTLLIVPITVSVLLDIRISIMTNILVSLLLFFIIPDISIVLPYMIAGGIGAFLVSDKKERLKLSLAGLLVSAITAILFVISMIIFNIEYQEAIRKFYIVFLSGVFSIVFVVGTLPFFESVFNMLTPFVLLELSNPNQPLLKKLLMEAPGTYHHSLMVGNLAEEATSRIGGNSLLARVGAYYHDIGKTERQNLFAENQMGENPHDKMNPKLSAFVITSHVTDGLKIANKYKLPKPIKDIIISHHGNTLVSFFYNKALEKNQEVNEEDYRYKAPRPSTNEAAVVMLADSVEAAVRSLEDKSKGKIEGFIRKIIKGKLEDGQLDLCNLTLKDLDEIAKGFIDVLNGYFHERVKYKDNDEI